MRHYVAGLVLAISSLTVQAATLDKIAAVVDDDVVLNSELNNRIADVAHQFRTRNQVPPPDDVLQKQVLEQLILQHIQVNMAERAGVRIDDNALNNTLGDIAKQNNLTLNQFRDKLESEGKGNYNQVREQVRQEMMLNRLRSRKVGERVRISEQEINNFLASPQGKEALASEYHLAHILIQVPDAPSPDQLATAKAKAEMALAELKKGMPLEQVAARYSNAEDALQGGDLGWRKAAQLPSLFADAVAPLQKGESVGPLQSPAGFHILVLLDKRGADQMLVHQRHVRHILIKPSEILTLDDAHQKAEELAKRLQQGADFADLAKTYSDDTGSARSGGELGWVTNGEMVPEFESMMNNTPINSISPVFQSQFGWHILQVLGERDQDMTKEYQRNLARQALYGRKYDEELASWLREIRGEAFVQMRGTVQ